ncbi:hypothetical protein PR202_ga03088 [Eleusine coracana subsp. coracana]|uniref:Uncharacterized protein n=1 Tax=Eleusine coracana subsp. coracana TaxID=191504 RepID=A0AAV5BMG9_ELECO|nr:hypothetical protein PR202_ga03088 [Eleusine coracana subsp. coracana]
MEGCSGECKDSTAINDGILNLVDKLTYAASSIIRGNYGGVCEQCSPCFNSSKKTDAPTDLLGMNESTPDTSEIIDQKNALALAIVQQDNAPKAPAPSSTENVATSWELALVTAPSSSGNGATSSKLGGGLDLLTLDSLYNEAHRRAQQNVSYNPWETISASGQVMQQPMHDPFYASNSIATARNVQMATMAQQQQAFMLQQQHMMMMAGQQVHHQHSSNPFADPYMYAGVRPHGAGMQLHAGNTYTGTRML